MEDDERARQFWASIDADDDPDHQVVSDEELYE